MDVADSALNHNTDSIVNQASIIDNSREKFLQNAQRWIMYNPKLNFNNIWTEIYSHYLQSAYKSIQFPNISNPWKIGHLITFRLSDKYEFMQGILTSKPNSNYSIYNPSNASHLSIKIIPTIKYDIRNNDSIYTQNFSSISSNDIFRDWLILPWKLFDKEKWMKANENCMPSINEQSIFMNMNGNAINMNAGEKNKESNVYLSHNWRYDQPPDGKQLMMIAKHKSKLKMNFVIGGKYNIIIAEYEIFEHREIVWSKAQSFDWYPAQILFHFHYGSQLSPSFSNNAKSSTAENEDNGCKSNSNVIEIIDVENANTKENSVCSTVDDDPILKVMVAFFACIDTSFVFVDDKCLMPFNEEPAIDRKSLENNGKKYDVNIFKIAVEHANKQYQCQQKLHSVYHHSIHAIHCVMLRSVRIPDEYWLYQKIFVFWEQEKQWFPGRIMHYCPFLNESSKKFFVLYDDGDVEWIDIHKDMVDWCQETERNTDNSAQNKQTKEITFNVNDESTHQFIHTLRNCSIHKSYQRKGRQSSDFIKTEKDFEYDISRRLLFRFVTDSAFCWVCRSYVPLQYEMKDDDGQSNMHSSSDSDSNLSPNMNYHSQMSEDNTEHICNGYHSSDENASDILSLMGKISNISHLECVCCKRRVHIKCLMMKHNITLSVLFQHRLQMHCYQCQDCCLCRHSIFPSNVMTAVFNSLDIQISDNDEPQTDSNIKKEKSSSLSVDITEDERNIKIECDLCRRKFHFGCLPKKEKSQLLLSLKSKTIENVEQYIEQDLQWLCMDCRVCRICDSKSSTNNVWFDGYSVCVDCNSLMHCICRVCNKHWNKKQKPFGIQCLECEQLIHLSCTPYTLDQLYMYKYNNEKQYFVCRKCCENPMNKLFFTVIELLLELRIYVLLV